MRKLIFGLLFLASYSWADISVSEGDGDKTVKTATVGGKEIQIIAVYESSNTVTPTVGGNAVSTSNPLPVQSTGTTTVNGSVTATINGTPNVFVTNYSTSSGVAVRDDSVYNAQSSTFTPVGGLYDTVFPIMASTGTTGAFAMTGYRALHINLRDSNNTELGTLLSPVYVIHPDPIFVDQNASPWHMDGAAAHDSAVSGNPVLMGAEARNSVRTPVSNGDVVRVLADLYGRQVVSGSSVTVTSSSGTAITTATETTLISSPGSGKHLNIKYVHASNSSSTAVVVSWKDGNSGSRRYETYLPQGGVFGHNFRPDYWALPTNTSFVLHTSASGNVYWTVEYEIVSD